MKAAVCLIGTELTRGVIQDSHTKLIASTLDSAGFEMLQVSIVPDDGTVGPLLQDLLPKVDVIICTGGLGPTSDDITRDVIAQVAGVDLVTDQQALKDLGQTIRRAVTSSNKRQVMIPRGFSVIKNPLGTAPGFWGGVGDTKIFCIPGPPAEMERMFLQEVMPQLKDAEGPDETLEASAYLIPESVLEDMCQQVCPPDISWGTRIQPLRISLYIRGGNREQRMKMLQDLQQTAGSERIREGGAELAEKFIDSMRSKNLNCVFAESCTGGMLAKIITDIPGSSSVLWGSYVTYADDAKQRMLGVSAETLETCGAVSLETVAEMAEGALERSQADVACAVSGVAGPDGGTKEKPVGTVCFAFAAKGRETAAVQMRWTYPRRDLIRRRSVISALLLCEAFMNGLEVVDIVNKWQYS